MPETDAESRHPADAEGPPSGPPHEGDPPCLVCQRPLEGRDRDRSTCHECLWAARTQHRQTMAHLIIWASAIRADVREESSFVEEVGPEIRHLAARKFGHAGFSLATWGRLVDWLVAEHAEDGKLEDISRSRVVDLLDADLRPASPSPIIASRSILNRAMGVCATNSKHIELRQERGELTFKRVGSGQKAPLAVTMTNPQDHRRLECVVAEIKSRS